MYLNQALRLDFTQDQVDFVIPRLDEDLPLCIDPFLLFKSRDESVRQLHRSLIGVFNEGIKLYESNRLTEFRQLIGFPEVSEIGMGYSEHSQQGSGLGLLLNKLLADTLAASEALRERGLRHIEELQLLSIGIGADRVSDIAANALKQYLIGYTQEQAALWSIPTKPNVPIAHIFDVKDQGWFDGYFDLPVSPNSGRPILLVPRRMVRLLPWINYNEYESAFRSFLQPSARIRTGAGTRQRNPAKALPKTEVVALTRANLEVLDRYVSRKEEMAADALPVYPASRGFGHQNRLLGEEFISRLDSTPTGPADANTYQRLVYEIVNYLFEPDLTDGEMEVKTIDGTERRDLVYTNESESSFLRYVRTEYHSPFLMFEVKNVQALDLSHINQTATYLGARLGTLGFIATRSAPKMTTLKKTFSVYNDSVGTARKVILILSDNDLAEMLRAKDSGDPNTPIRALQKKYRAFRTTIQ